jgi:hypothetical protein
MRRMRTLLGSALLAGAAACAVVATLPSAADAGTLAQAGWWWRLNDGGLPAPVPVPPNVPEGGLMVAGAPDGATAIAALHFDLTDDETAPVLTLAVAENGDQGGEGALLAACLTGSAWQPAQGGAWTSKPFPACAEGSVNGVRSDDGTTWTFALAPLASDGILDVTLVPGVDPTRPEGANGSVFQLVFAAPTAASLATSSGGGGASDFAVPDFAAPDLGPAGGTSFDSPAAGGDLSLPPVAAAGFEPALPEADQGLTATAPVTQERNAPLDAETAAAIKDHTGLAAVVLALCGGALLWSGQLPVPDTRGVGRFARVRSGPAPRL